MEYLIRLVKIMQISVNDKKGVNYNGDHAKATGHRDCGEAASGMG